MWLFVKCTLPNSGISETAIQTDIMQQTIRSLLKVRTAVVTDKYSTLHGTTDTVSLYEETQIHGNALDILPPSFTTSTTVVYTL